MKVLGIDPGVNGGMAVIDRDSGKVEELWSLSGCKTAELGGYIRCAAQNPNTIAFLEQVAYIKGDGGMGSFTFGKVYGGLLVGLQVAGIKVLRVPPMVWMTNLACLTGGNKDVSLNKARSLFPSIPLNEKGKKGWALSVADALLIAEYGRRVLLRPTSLEA